REGASDPARVVGARRPRPGRLPFHRRHRGGDQDRQGLRRRLGGQSRPDGAGVPARARLVRLRPKTQSPAMKSDERGGGDDLDFKTRDGNNVGVDVTVLYHIDIQSAPKVLRTVAKDMSEVRQVLVRPLARSIPRDSLNELSSEEFYESDKRS